MKPITVAILGFDGVAGLDLIGPLEAFAVAEADGRKCYNTRIVGLTSRPFAAESGVVFRPHASLEKKIDIDTLIVPGGPGLRNPATNRRVVSWLLKRAPRIRRITSVCTGIYGLAPTGLLDGRHVVTHWRFARDVGQRFPRVKMDANALFTKDGKFYTSAGVTAGIDLALCANRRRFRHACRSSGCTRIRCIFETARRSGAILRTSSIPSRSGRCVWRTCHLDTRSSPRGSYCRHVSQTCMSMSAAFQSPI